MDSLTTLNSLVTASRRAGRALAAAAVVLVPWVTDNAADVGAGATGAAGLLFPEPVHSFGQVSGGVVVTHDFAFANPGTEPVEVKHVKSSCGCLVIGPWPKRVEGGQGGVVPVQFATANYSGHVAETVTVTCADPALPPVVLEVEATVWWPIEITPRSAVFEFGANSGTNAFTVVRIVNHEPTPLELREPSTSHRSLGAMLRTNTPGQEYELIIRTIPPLPPGNLFGQVKLPTSSTNLPVLEIPVAGLLQPDVVVTPARLTIPAGGITERLQQTVSVRSFWTNGLELAAPTISHGAVGVLVHPVKPGRSYDVTFTYPEGFALAPTEKVECRLETNHPRYRLLRLTVSPEVVPSKP